MIAKSFQGHAPAKLNLALHVTGQRTDGYHELDSLVVFARPGDGVRIQEAQTDSFAVSGIFAASLNADDDNLVLRAKAQFEAAFPELDLPALNIELQKNLPIASGIGGGSADAAATLKLLATIMQVDKDPRVKEAAKQLGADVPMCLSVTPKRVVGVGDQFESVSGVPPCHAILVNPLTPVSTPEVFARLENRQNPSLPERVGDWPTLEALAAYLRSTRNDLQEAALSIVPDVAEIEQAVAALDGCQFARMSGSGATVFGLFETARQAQHAESQLRAQRPNDWIASVEIHDSGGFDAD